MQKCFCIWKLLRTFAAILKNMNFYTQEQMVDKHVGAKGTPARDEYNERVELMLVVVFKKHKSLVWKMARI